MANAAAGQAAIQLQGMHAGNAEHGVDAIIGQQAYQGLAAGQGFVCMLISSGLAEANQRIDRSRALGTDQQWVTSSSSNCPAFSQA